MFVHIVLYIKERQEILNIMENVIGIKVGREGNMILFLSGWVSLILLDCIY
jgi:hypothetical protein